MLDILYNSCIGGISIWQEAGWPTADEEEGTAQLCAAIRLTGCKI